MNDFKLRPGDLFAIPPGGWLARQLCRIIGAKTFHWGMFVDHDSEEWIITESIGKGVAITRFSYPRAYIYRIKGVEVKAKDVISVHSHYGEWRYDWDVPLKTALWWLLKHYFGKVIPRWRDKEVNCQEWVCLLAIELGVRVIPEDEYPMCVNLEHSPNLEYLGETC